MSKLFLNYQKMVMLTSWCYPESISPSTNAESRNDIPSRSEDSQPPTTSSTCSRVAKGLISSCSCRTFRGCKLVLNLQRNGHHFAGTKQKKTWRPQQKWRFSSKLIESKASWACWGNMLCTQTELFGGSFFGGPRWIASTKAADYLRFRNLHETTWAILRMPT